MKIKGQFVDSRIKVNINGFFFSLRNNQDSTGIIMNTHLNTNLGVKGCKTGNNKVVQ